MDINGHFVEKVPFPYFILDGQLKIIKASKQAQRIFHQAGSFIELINDLYREEIITFLKNLTLETTDFIKVPMHHRNNTESYYQIYKAADETSILHVYCLPIDTDLANLNEMIDTAKQKLFYLNNEYLQKELSFEKIVEQMKDTVKAVDHQQNIENLAAEIAHEIRNPLTTVKGFLQLIKPNLKEVGKEQYADVALEEIDRTTNIIYDFLNLAKPQTDSCQDTSLNKIVNDLIMLYEGEALLKHIQIATQLENDDVFLTIPVNQLKQVLINVIKNAIEAINDRSAEKRIIHISTQTHSTTASISITDSGGGITKENMQKLFIPFYSTKEAGTGIGLNISKKIVEQHGGTITVKSKLGEGTTFTIAFPIKSIS